MGGGRRGGTALGIAFALALATDARAGAVLVDLTESRQLEARQASAASPPGRTADLLLVEVIRERIAARVLAPSDAIPVVAVRGDGGPPLGRYQRLTVGELLQAVLLTDSRTAARSLAAAAGPGEERARARMRAAAMRLALHTTTIADAWPARPSPAAAGATTPGTGRTTAADLARLATALWRDADLRRRATLDGVPIANGSVILRATAPLIRTAPPPATALPSPAREDERSAGADLAVASGGGLELLAVVTGPDTSRAWDTAARGLARYERVPIVRQGQAVGRSIRVRGGILSRFTAIAAEPFALTIRRGVAPTLGILLQLPSAVEAPVEVAQPVGELVFTDGGRLIGAVPLVAPVAVAPSGWLDTARH